MTDRVSLIRAEIERRIEEEKRIRIEKEKLTGIGSIIDTRYESLLSFIDSMQAEPTTSVWHDASEKPKEGSWICVSFASRDLSTFLYEDGKIHNDYVDIEMISCKWAYPEDLLKL